MVSSRAVSLDKAYFIANDIIMPFLYPSINDRDISSNHVQMFKSSTAWICLGGQHMVSGRADSIYRISTAPDGTMLLIRALKTQREFPDVCLNYSKTVGENRIGHCHKGLRHESLLASHRRSPSP